MSKKEKRVIPRRLDEIVKSPYIAVMINGQITIHAHDDTGNYATLCGVDGDDPHPGVQQVPIDVPCGQKINCRQCYGIWTVAKQLKRGDFEI